MIAAFQFLFLQYQMTVLVAVEDNKRGHDVASKDKILKILNEHFLKKKDDEKQEQGS